MHLDSHWNTFDFQDFGKHTRLNEDIPSENGVLLRSHGRPQSRRKRHSARRACWARSVVGVSPYLTLFSRAGIDREQFDAFKAPRDPSYSLLGSIDSLLLMRSEVLAGALTNPGSHAIVDRGSLVGLWEYDLATESIPWASFVKPGRPS